VNKGGFVANTLTLAGGNFIAQAIIIGLTPIITRLYPPQSYGIFAIFVSIALPLSFISHLRYNLAIFLPSDEEDANALALLGIVSVIIISLVLFFAFLFLGNNISRIFNIQDFTYILFFIPLYILIDGTILVLSSWYLRAKDFKRLASSKILGSLGDRSVTLILGLKGFINPGGLVAGKITGELFDLVNLLMWKRKNNICLIFSPSSFKRLKSVAIRYKDFPKYVWSSLFQSYATHLSTLLFGFFFNPTIVGHFALSSRVLSEPMLMVGEAIARSFFQKASEAYRSGNNLAEMSERLFRYLLMFIFLPMVLLGITGVEVFSLVFGEKWGQAGLYASLLVPLSIGNFLFQPARIFFYILEKQKEDFIFNVIYFFVNAVSLIVGGLLGNPYFMAGIYSFSTTLLFAVRLSWLLSQVGVMPKTCLKIFGKTSIRTIVFALPIIFIKIFFSPSPWLVIITAVLLCFSYFIYILLTDQYLKNETILFLKNHRFFSFFTYKMIRR
jgi:lipopolysaccharide exporter